MKKNPKQRPTPRPSFEGRRVKIKRHVSHASPIKPQIRALAEGSSVPHLKRAAEIWLANKHC